MNRESRIHCYDPIIDQLKAERKRRGLTLQQLGEQIGRKTYGAVWQWESRTHDLRLSNLRQWADALGYDVALVRRGQTDPAADAGRVPDTGGD